MFLELSYRYRIWHYSGNMLEQVLIEKGKELWETKWQPGKFDEPVISSRGIQAAAAVAAPAPEGEEPYEP